jgi:hypothetical protein
LVDAMYVPTKPRVPAPASCRGVRQPGPLPRSTPALLVLSPAGVLQKGTEQVMRLVHAVMRESKAAPARRVIGDGRVLLHLTSLDQKCPPLWNEPSGPGSAHFPSVSAARTQGQHILRERHISHTSGRLPAGVRRADRRHTSSPVRNQVLFLLRQPASTLPIGG